MATKDHPQEKNLSGCWAVVAVGFVASLLAIATGIIDIYKFISSPPLRDEQPALKLAPANEPGRVELEPTQAVAIESAREVSTIHESAIRNAMDLSRDVSIQALRELDATPLNKVFKRQALAEQSALVEELRSNQVYGSAERYSITFDSIKTTADSRNAIVEATENWGVIFYSTLDDQCVGMWAPRDTPQTIFLELDDSDWMITTISYKNSTDSLPMLPCS